jgi:hypothetical protein
VPFATFEVIVYYRMNEEHSFNISSQQCATGRTPTTVRPLAAVTGAFVAAAYPSPSNYLRLTGCKGTNLTIEFTSGGEQANHRKSLAALQIVESGGSASPSFSSSSSPPRSIGLNIVGKLPKDKTGPIVIGPEVEAGVVAQRNWVNLDGMHFGCGVKEIHFNASQHLYEARIDGSAGKLRSSSVMQANENTLITRLECTGSGCGGGANTKKQRVQVSLALSNFWKLPSAAGVSSTQLWTRHENNYADQNPMALGSCDPHAIFVRGVARFVLKANSKQLTVSNGTENECPMLLPPGAAAGPWAQEQKQLRLVARGPCADPLSNWTLVPSSNSSSSSSSSGGGGGGNSSGGGSSSGGDSSGGGDSGEAVLYLIRSAHTPQLCLGVEASSKDLVAYALDCNSNDSLVLLLWSASTDPTSGRPFSLELEKASSLGSEQATSGEGEGCLVSTAGNTNNTLAIVTEVREDGRAIVLDTPKSDGSLTAQGSFEMEAGHMYELVTTLISRRDLAEPGQYRYGDDGPSSAAGPAAAARDADVVAAAAHAAAAVNTTALLIEHSAWWRSFWNMSSVDLGPQYQVLKLCLPRPRLREHRVCTRR